MALGDPAKNRNDATVSVVMATYGERPDFLTQALQSVLLQVRAPEEILVVIPDDDPNLEALKEFKSRFELDTLRIVRSRTADQHHQRNVGAKKAEGKYLAFVDSDDYLLPNKLWLEVKMAENKGSVLAFTQFFYTDEWLNMTKLWRGEPPTLEGLRRQCKIPDYALVLRSAMEEIGYFDPSYGVAATYDAWLKLAEKHLQRFVFRQTPTWLYRQHKRQRSRDRPLQDGGLGLRKKALEEHYKRCGEKPPTVEMGYEVAGVHDAVQTEAEPRP